MTPSLNLAFHAISSVLVYVLFVQLGRVRGAALVAALLFAVHPLSGIVVNYISARDLAMTQAFMLASLVCYTRMRLSGRDSAAGWAAALLFAAVATLAKTNAAVLPLIVALFVVAMIVISAGNDSPFLYFQF